MINAFDTNRDGHVDALDTTGDEDWPATLAPVRYSLAVETELFIEHTLFDGAGTFTALLTDNHGYMSAQTAPIYGDGASQLPGEMETRRFTYIAASTPRQATITLYPAEFPADQRAGVLTLPSILALGAYAVQPGPILRGKRILERLVCPHLEVAGNGPRGRRCGGCGRRGDAARREGLREQRRRHGRSIIPGLAVEQRIKKGRSRTVIPPSQSMRSEREEDSVAPCPAAD